MFFNVKEAIESGAPFRVGPGGFSLTDLNDTEKKILKNAMAQQKHVNVLIRTKEEHIFIGDLLTLQSRIESCVIQMSTVDGIEYLAEGLKHSFIKMVLFRTAFNQHIDNSIAIEALKETKSLRTIDLGVSAEQNAVVEALSNPNIETFNLRNLFNHQVQMDLNDETFERFAAVLSTHPTLTQLSLCRLSHASFTALGEALKNNLVLQNLIINEENGSESMRRLCEGLKMNSSLKSLAVIAADEGTGELFKSLANNSIKLTSIRFGLESNVIAQHNFITLTEALKTNSTLTTLDVSFTNIDDEKCRLLCEGLMNNKSIQVLNLSANNIGLNGVTAIRTLLQYNTTMRHLNVATCQFTTNHIQILCDGIKHNRSLTALNFYDNRLDLQAYRYICDALKTNRSLISCCFGVKSVLELESAEIIKEILLSNSTLQDVGIRHKFETASVFQPICDSLKVNQSLTKLVLFSVKEELHDMIVGVLQVNQALTSVRTGWSNTPAEIEALTTRNRQLQSEIKYKVTVLARNIAHSSSALSLLPCEIWQLILKQISHPGVVSFDSIVDKAFVSPK